MTPGETIKKKLRDRGWTQRDLANILDRPLPKVNEIITGKTAITPETAIQLAQAFGDKPEEWMLAESKYRLSLADSHDKSIEERARLYSLGPIKEMEKRGWIKKTQRPQALECELKAFFGVESLEENPSMGISTKRTDRLSSLNPAQRAWCFRACNLSKMVSAKPYNTKNFESCVNSLRKLVTWPEESRKVSRILSDFGIRLVIVEPIARTRIDGAAFWLNEQSPVIALSLRYDRIDNFWSGLAHELSHVKHKDGLRIDIDMLGEDRQPEELDAIELRADRESATTWIPKDVIDDFVIRTGPLYSLAQINQFANRIKVHPGIIVGQLQHRGELSFGSYRKTLLKIRKIITESTLTDGWGHTVESQKAS